MNMIVSAAALTAGSKAIASVQSDDSVLLDLEEKIFEHQAAATGYDAEIERLGAVVQSEGRRLYDEALAEEVRQGRYLTPDERWNRVSAMPESKERSRLIELQDAHWYAMDESINQMWATPAHTPEGRRAKVLVLLGAILGDDWRSGDWHCEYETKRARSLLIELVGGEPAKQLRDQFAA
ncbi:MAG: hypothetical protein P4M15_04935 [Alphaproteobacteria bacterium]|nr:hypothetical protein [Alphaproteobacteria bacterium]